MAASLPSGKTASIKKVYSIVRSDGKSNEEGGRLERGRVGSTLTKEEARKKLRIDRLRSGQLGLSSDYGNKNVITNTKSFDWQKEDELKKIALARDAKKRAMLANMVRG
jgi:hypothetical protein